MLFKKSLRNEALDSYFRDINKGKEPFISCHASEGFIA